MKAFKMQFFIHFVQPLTISTEVTRHLVPGQVGDGVEVVRESVETEVKLNGDGWSLEKKSIGMGRNELNF